MKVIVKHSNGTLMDSNGQSPIEFKKIAKKDAKKYLLALYGAEGSRPWFPQYAETSVLIVA